MYHKNRRSNLFFFLVYINDLPLHTNFDTNLTLAEKSVSNLQNLVNLEMCKIDHWMHANKLSINSTKSQYMLVTKKKIDLDHFKVSSNNSEIKRNECIKYLGVLIDDKLCWKNHINYTCSKISKGCWALQSLKNILPPNFLIDVYHSLIYSHICYCITCSECASKTRLMPLIKLQKRAVFIITYKRYRDHINPLFLDCKLLKIAEIYKLELSKLIFKVHKNILTTSDSTTFIPVSTVHHYHTRYRAENFHRKQILKQYMKNLLKFQD